MSGRRCPGRGYGRRLCVARLVLGVTEGEAPAALGITLRTYRKWEARRWPHVSAGPVLAFAEIYNVSVDWLVYGEGFGLKPHLTVRTAGKLAILPIDSAEAAARREALARRLAEVDGLKLFVALTSAATAPPTERIETPAPAP